MKSLVAFFFNSDISIDRMCRRISLWCGFVSGYRPCLLLLFFCLTTGSAVRANRGWLPDSVNVTDTIGGASSVIQTDSSSSPRGVTMTEPTTLTDPRDGKVYRTRVMADGREWMIEDLKFGNCSASSFNSYWQTTAKDVIAVGYYGVCIASKQSGAGYLYNWQAAMNSGNTVYQTNGNPSGNVEGCCPKQWQGICPPGWHLPSGGSTGEFQQLMTVLGDVSKICPGTTCDGWRGVAGGYGDGRFVVNAGSYGYCWSSTYVSTSCAYGMYFGNGGVRPQDYDNKYYGFAVRCVRNY